MSDIWSPLTHENVLNQVESVLGQKLSNLVLERNSYINRVFELGVKGTDEKIITKFYRPGRWTAEQVVEEHIFLSRLEEREVPVIAPLTINKKTLFSIENIYFTIFPKKGGRAMDEFDKDSWELVGRLVGRMHMVGRNMQKSSRIVWRPDVVSKANMQFIMDSHSLPADYITPFENAVKLFINKFSNSFSTLELFLIHGDLHKGNLIHRLDEGVFVIDFDDICVGPAVQDLWMLLPAELEHSEQEISWFLKGYNTFFDFNLASLKLVPVLKVMRQLHFAAWCAMQKNDPRFIEHFPDWGSIRYWNELIKDIQQAVYN